MNRVLLLAAASLLCSGCVVYSQPPQSADIAQVEFRRDPAVNGLTFEQVLSSVDGPECKQIAFIGNYHPLTDALKIGGWKVFRARSTQRLFLLASTYDTSVGANVYAQCTNLISFVPEAGHRYAVTQIYRNDSCRAGVIDLTDSETVDSFESHEVAGRCEKGRSG